MSPSGDFTLDFERRSRTGLEEAVLCAGKTAETLGEILDRAVREERTLLLTRLERRKLEALPPARSGRIDYDPLSRTGFFGPVPAPAGTARIAVVTAGTSDLPASREAARTLAYAGEACAEFNDVGVAGLWRLLERVEELRTFPVVIVAAGFDAALPSVVGGLVPGAVIAVPTSTGYGIAEGGITALRAILASCAPGVVAVNIDNGYGAACAALRVLGNRSASAD